MALANGSVEYLDSSVRKWLSIARVNTIQYIPSNVVVDVVFVTVLSQFLRKGVFSPLFRISNTSPLPERAMHSNPVVIDLVSTAKPVSDQLLF